MLTIFKNAEVFSPSPMGQKDVLVGGNTILAIAAPGKMALSGLPVEVVDATGKWLVPGLIDAHVHITGGGGEGGFRTRTPELVPGDMVRAGVTTVVGTRGTDGTTRTMAGLVAKVKSLKDEGLSAYCYTGSYRLPLRTLTGNIQDDLILIEEIIGVGEVAVSDHRSSQAGLQELQHTIAEARVGGMLAGKAGLVNIHMGDGPGGLGPVKQVMAETQIPIQQVLPTHVNRNGNLFNEALAFAKAGGRVDVTTSSTPQFVEEGEIPAAKAVETFHLNGIPSGHLSMTSDGQGSLPSFDDQGRIKGLTIGRCDTLLAVVKEACRLGVPFAYALATVTETPASWLKLSGKGRIQVGKDADILLINPQTFEMDHYMALGTSWITGGKRIKWATFE